jgi:hypothetical protein
MCDSQHLTTPYKPPRPVTGIALLSLFLFTLCTFNHRKEVNSLRQSFDMPLYQTAPAEWERWVSDRDEFVGVRDLSCFIHRRCRIFNAPFSRGPARLGAAWLHGSMSLAMAGGGIRFRSDPSSFPRDVSLRRENEYFPLQVRRLRSLKQYALRQEVRIRSKINCLRRVFAVFREWLRLIPSRTCTLYVVTDIAVVTRFCSAVMCYLV